MAEYFIDLQYREKEKKERTEFDSREREKEKKKKMIRAYFIFCFRFRRHFSSRLVFDSYFNSTIRLDFNLSAISMTLRSFI